jgi:hypothetical protein
LIRTALTLITCLCGPMSAPPSAAQTTGTMMTETVTETETQAVATVPAVPDDDMRIMAALTGRKMVGRPVSGPFPTADKLLILTRNENGTPTIGASFALSTRQSLNAPPADTLAIIRMHPTSETIIPGPTADDLAFVATHKIPLYVIGEWARPAPMWELAFVDDKVRYRTIGEVGEIGPWRD